MIVDDTKPLTEKKLIGALAEFFETVLAPEFGKITENFEKIQKRFNSIDGRLDQIDQNSRDTRRRTLDLEADTPSHDEFKKLEHRVAALEKTPSQQ